MMLILDFYVDEPACLGVPPYLSTYSRYLAGALVDGGLNQKDISYLTVDELRADNFELKDDYEAVVVVAGHTVPGRYLGGKIGSYSELLQFLNFRRKFQKKGLTVVGGPIRHINPAQRQTLEESGGVVVSGDLELFGYQLAQMGNNHQSRLSELQKLAEQKRLRRSYEQVDRWSEAGAFLGNLHPNFPYLMIELESYRGCTRDAFCSFCTEQLYGKPDFRTTEGLAAEVRELHSMGERYFRLGRQADLITYQADLSERRHGFPRPRPERIAELYVALRRAAPELKVLHLDNINPGAIAAYPEESREIIKIICEHNTPGDTAAMGLESVEAATRELNRLKCGPDEARRAIEIINEIGGKRSGGIPHLLPGVNLIHGLPGETRTTFKKNFEFLKEIKDAGLLLRRTNIRRANIYPDTPLERLTGGINSGEVKRTAARKKGLTILEQKFLYYRDRIRNEIDRPLLEKCFPPGTIVREVLLEQFNGGFYYGRPLGSYPVTIKLPAGDPGVVKAFQAKTPLDVFIVSAAERSLMGLGYPVTINTLDLPALNLIKGIGKKRSAEIFNRRPLASYQELCTICPDGLPGESRDYSLK